MRRLIVLLPCILVFVVACGVKVSTPVGTISGPKVSVPKVPIVQKQLAASDIFEGDEYLVQWGDYYIGKLLTAPSEVEKEAEFLVYYGEGEKRWESDFFQVSHATAADLTTGSEVVYFGGNEREEVFYLPVDRLSARQGVWYKRFVTDTSLLASRGILYIGDSKVDKDNVFVVIK